MDIKSAISNLDYKHREVFFKKLSFNERRKVVRSLRSGQEISGRDKSVKDIFKKINDAKEFQINITHESQSNHFFAKIIRKLKKGLAEVASFFGIYTAKKTQAIANKCISTSYSSLKGIKKSLSSRKLISIIKKEKIANPNVRLDLKEILKKHGYPPVVSDCSFNKSDNFLNVDLKDIKFENCKFEWCPFSNCFLTGVTFENCNLINISFLKAEINTCKFDNCNLQEIMFTDAKIDSVEFSACTVVGSSFEDASITNSVFHRSSLHASHFLEASVKDCVLKECNLRDAVFFGTLENFIVDNNSKKTALMTRPATAILVDPENKGVTTPKAFFKLDRTAHLIPLRISLKAQKANSEHVNSEIESALKDIGSYNRNNTPIPQQLIKCIKEDPIKNAESLKILNKAEKLASEVDSFFLPGGEDVPPSLYGEKVEEHTNWGNDYRRSILELGIIQQSFIKGIPMMAVCRGFQMSNVYFGAQLLQDVKGQRGVQNFNLVSNEHRGLYDRIFQKSIFSAVFHHQAVSKDRGATEHLEPSVFYQNLIKASELKYSGAAPMVLLQFHPEYYKARTADSWQGVLKDKAIQASMSEGNEEFWGILSDSAKAYRIKKIALSELKKVFPGAMGLQSNDSDVLPAEAISKRMIAIKKLEDKENRLFAAFQSNYYSERKGLLQLIINVPDKARRYFAPSNDGISDLFPEEQAIILSALKQNETFARQLGKEKLSLLMSIIQEFNPEQYKDLSAIDYLKL